MSVTSLTQYVDYELVYVCLCECGCPHSCHASICVSVYLQELECVRVHMCVGESAHTCARVRNTVCNAQLIMFYSSVNFDE